MSWAESTPVTGGLAPSFLARIFHIGSRDIFVCHTRHMARFIFEYLVWINRRSSDKDTTSSLQKLLSFRSQKKQTKWPIELWTLKQEMESDDDPATMRESFSLVSLVGKCAWKDAVYYAIWFAFFDNTFWEELLVSLKYVSRHFVSRATKLKIVQKFCLMVEISLSNHVLL